jgi:iron(III) transport system ATP-binding protein
MGFLEISGLTKRYGPLTVIDGLSLSVEKGTLVCLLGPSGCGKTTTLRLIAGFGTPDAGIITVDGLEMSSAHSIVSPDRRGMSMIFQNYALWPHMTVYDNVAYGLKLRDLKASEVRQRADAVLDMTHLRELSTRYPGELSGGQQQRVSLARALVVEPRILLLDEPLSNLDANLREEMRFEIRRLHDEFHYTTVYVTHDQSEAMTTADLIVVMDRGIIRQAGTPEEIYAAPRNEFVARFIGGTNIFRGRWDGDATVDCGHGITLRCDSGEFVADGDTLVSVRHQNVELESAQPNSPEDPNWVAGTVKRQSYLGATRDYVVELVDGGEVRAVVSADIKRAPGQSVWVHLPPYGCRALAE